MGFSGAEKNKINDETRMFFLDTVYNGTSYSKRQDINISLLRQKPVKELIVQLGVI